MASLNKQLEYLSPVLDKSVSMKELQIQLLAKKQESHYKHQGNLLSELGQIKAQSKIFTFSSDFRVENFFTKIKRLVSEFDKQTSIDFIKTDNGWNLNINGNNYPIGDIPGFFISGRVSAVTINIPEFIKNICKALKSILTHGNFHYGYWKDEDTAITNNFSFLLLFIPHGQENLLKKFGRFEWHLPGDSHLAKKTGSIRINEESGNTILSWRKKSTWLTVFLIILGIILGVAFSNMIFKFREIIIPANYLIMATIALLILAVFDYINRSAILVLDKDKLVLKNGAIPILPGYKRRSYQFTDIIRVFTKTVSLDSGTSDGGGGVSYMKAIYITTREPKEIKLIDGLEKNEALMIEDKIQKYINQKTSA